MRCPSCKCDMIVVEHNKIELDYCTNCLGIWFDSQELELLLNSTGLDSRGLFPSNTINSPETRSPEKKRRCPICTKQMKKTTIGQQPEILIDICQRGDGLWFDGGEIASLIKQLADKTSSNRNSQQQILDFLRETFKAQI